MSQVRYHRVRLEAGELQTLAGVRSQMATPTTSRIFLCLIVLLTILHSGCLNVDARYGRLRKRLPCGTDRSTAISVVSDLGLRTCRPEASLPAGLESKRVPADQLCSGDRDFVALWFTDSGTLEQYEFGSSESSEANTTGTNYPPVKCSRLKERS